MMKTISVLGSGWLGLPLAQNLKESGFSIKASTTSPERLSLLEQVGAEPFLVNIENLSNEVDGFLKSDILIINITSKNIDAFRELIAKIEESSIQKVIFISSTSVYKSCNKTVSESDHNLLTESPLRIIEELFQNSQKFNTTIIRFGGLIGYSRNPGRFFAGGKTLRDPDGRVNLIHRDDCIGIIHKVIEKQAWGETFNGCADTHPTKREFYSKAASAIGLEIKQFGSNETPFKIVSNEKVKSLLGYKFIHSNLMKIY